MVVMPLTLEPITDENGDGRIMDTEALPVITGNNATGLEALNRLRSLQSWACEIASGNAGECARFNGTSE